MVLCCTICRTFPTNESLICSKSRRIRLRGFNLWILVTGEPSVENGLGGKFPWVQRQDYHEDYGDWVWKWPQVKEVAFGNNRTEEMGGGFKYFVIFTLKIGEDSHFDDYLFKGVETTNYIGTDSLLQNSSISGILKQFFRSVTSATLECWVIS